MDPTSLTLGVLPLIFQFITYSSQLYDLYGTASNAGERVSILHTGLLLELQVLKNWASETGLDQKKPSVGPVDDNYLMVLKILAVIVKLLTDIDQVKAQLGVDKNPQQSKPSKARGRMMVVPAVFTFFRPSRSGSRGPDPPAGGDVEDYLRGAGVDPSHPVSAQLDALRTLAKNTQTKLSALEKVRWAWSDKDKLEGLIAELKVWNENLKRIPIPRKDGGGEFQVKFRLAYPKNPYFCGREDIFRQILQSFWPNGTIASSSGVKRSIVMLHGLGGVGKSQIAQEYTYRYESEYFSRLWINADNPAEVHKSCFEALKTITRRYSELGPAWGPRMIANALSICAKVESQEELMDALSKEPLESLKMWLARTGNTRWLLVIDNYNDIKSLDLHQFLQQDGFGHVLITTRDKSIAIGGKYEKIQVLEFDKPKGIEFLINRSDKKEVDDSEKTHAGNIVDLVGGLPLALEQAAAYVYAAECTFDMYENLLRVDRNRPLFQNRPEDCVFSTTQYTINTVWKLSFGRLDQNAVKLLELCSFISNRGIKHEMIKRGKVEVDWIKGNPPHEEIEEEAILQRAFNDLVILSFMTREGDPKEQQYGIHPLIHSWVRNEVSIGSRDPYDICINGSNQSQANGTIQYPDSKEAKEYSQLALFVITSNFQLYETRAVEEWAYELSLEPHVDCCHENFKDQSIPDLEKDLNYGKIQTSLYVLAQVFSRFGRVDTAHDIYSKIFSGSRKESLELDDLEMMDKFGKNLFLRGNNEDALEWYSRALSGREIKLGGDHPCTLNTRHNIAEVYKVQGMFHDALEEYKVIFMGQSSKDKPGEPSIATLETRQSIGVMKKSLGEYEEALSVLQEVLVEKEKMHDGSPNHPSILDTLHEIALLYEMKGEYKKANQEYTRVLKAQEATLGKDHYATIDTVHSLAGVYENQGQYKAALSLYNRALEGLEKTFGKTHPWTLMAVSGMADILEKEAQYDSALEKYLEVYHGLRERGVIDSRLYMTASDIGKAYLKLGKYDEALNWYTISKDGYTGDLRLGEDHVLVISSKFGIASVLEHQGKYNAAHDLYKVVLEGYRKAVGDDHDTTWTAKQFIAGVLRNKGRYDEAMDFYHKSEEVFEMTHGKDHILTLKSVAGRAGVLDDLGNYKDAMSLYKRAKEGLDKLFDEDHPVTLQVVYGMGVVLEHQESYDAAEEKYNCAHDGWEKRFNDKHPSTLLALYRIGNVQGKKQLYDEALLRYNKVLGVPPTVLGEDHPLRYQVLCGIGGVFRKQRHYSKALACYREAKEGLEVVVGPDHPLTLIAVHGMAGVFEKQKRYPEASRHYKIAWDGREKALGRKHPETELSRTKYTSMESWYKNLLRW